MASKTINISIEQLGTEMNRLANDIMREVHTVDLPLFYEKVNAIGKTTLSKIRENIKSAKKRPQAGEPETLENAMTIEYFKTGGWGIGKISYLNKVAPYWYFVNFGVSMKGMRIPGRGKQVPFGQFKPGEPKPASGSFQSGRWNKSTNSKETYTFKAKRGIQHPLNYIAKTNHYLNSVLDKWIAKGV